MSDNTPQTLSSEPLQLFLEDIQQLLDTPKISVDAILKTLKRAPETLNALPENEKKDYLQQIYEKLIASEFGSELEIKVIIEGACVQTDLNAPLIQPLSRYMKAQIAEAIRFPVSVTNYYEPQRQEKLNEWLQTQYTYEFKWEDEAWCQKLILCLVHPEMQHTDFITLCTVLQHAAFVQTPTFQNDQVYPYGFLMQELEKTLLKKNTTLYRWASMLLPHLQQVITEQAEQIDRLNRNNEALQAHLQQSKQDLKKKKDEISDAQSYIDELNSEIQELEAACAQEKEKNEHLKQYWENKHKQEMAHLRYNLKFRFDHEVQEAFLSLTDDPPNVSMALSRLQEMQDYLKTLES